MALKLFLQGSSYRQIARDLRTREGRVSEKAIRKWIAKYKLEEPLLHHRFEQKEKYTVSVTSKTINGNGGLFIQSYSEFFRNRILKMELIPKDGEGYFIKK